MTKSYAANQSLAGVDRSAGILHKALFLDRDGTLIVHHPYLADPAGVELLPGVRAALHKFIMAGWRLFLFTNQSGVGRGLFTLDTVHRCNQRMLQLMDLPPPGFTESCVATETPDMPQLYRKPSPRFILEMMGKYSLSPAEVWMVGDSVSDMQAGLNAGVRSALIFEHDRTDVPSGILQCRDMGELYTKLHYGQT
jgi:D-glycero-D-manno-heptose 1,7-bisphosphate phosphatase